MCACHVAPLRPDTGSSRPVAPEDASRFARQLIVQEAGIIALIERGVRVLTASGDDLTATEDPFKVAMRQIAGVFAQLEKARLVGKLKAARAEAICARRHHDAALDPGTLVAGLPTTHRGAPAWGHYR